jgi:2-methylcitrate dehydratase PrpD
VEITLTDGQVLIRQVDIPIGDPRDPLDTEGLSLKVRQFAGSRDMDRVNRVIEMVMNLDEMADITELTSRI